MDSRLREAQFKVLDIFKAEAEKFALAGGTALELYYLKHRFSADLDFFSTDYDIKEIERLFVAFKSFYKKISLENDFYSPNKARIRFYTIPLSGAVKSLKIDFVEDVIFRKPKIKMIDGLRVYDAETIYLMKLYAIAGTNPGVDDIGRTVISGRRETRDVFDVYMLSKKIKPLNVFLQTAPAHIQRGMIHWYRSFSRQDCKLALLDLGIYDEKFNAREMIAYLEDEVEKFIKQKIEK